MKKIELVTIYNTTSTRPGKVYSNKSVIYVDGANSTVNVFREYYDENRKLTSVFGECKLIDFMDMGAGEEAAKTLAERFLEHIENVTKKYKPEFKAKNIKEGDTLKYIVINGQRFEYSNTSVRSSSFNAAEHIIGFNPLLTLSTAMLKTIFNSNILMQEGVEESFDDVFNANYNQEFAQSNVTNDHDLQQEEFNGSTMEQNKNYQFTNPYDDDDDDVDEMF